jgi:hypothetical protein
MSYIIYVVASNKEEAERIHNESFRVRPDVYQSMRDKHRILGITAGKYPGFEHHYIGHSDRARARAKREGKNVYRLMPDKTWHKLKL